MYIWSLNKYPTYHPRILLFVGHCDYRRLHEIDWNRLHYAALPCVSCARVGGHWTAARVFTLLNCFWLQLKHVGIEQTGSIAPWFWTSRSSYILYFLWWTWDGYLSRIHLPLFVTKFTWIFLVSSFFNQVHFDFPLILSTSEYLISLPLVIGRIAFGNPLAIFHNPGYAEQQYRTT